MPVMGNPSRKEMETLAREKFGFQSLYPAQRRVIESVTSGRWHWVIWKRTNSISC